MKNAPHSRNTRALARARGPSESMHERLVAEQRLRREAEEVLGAVVARLGEVEGEEQRLRAAAQQAVEEQRRWQASARAAWGVAERESKVIHAHQLSRIVEQLSSAEQIANENQPVGSLTTHAPMTNCLST